MDPRPQKTSTFSHDAMDAAIKIGLLFVILIWCFQIVRPFIMPIVWGGIIAIALHPLVNKISEKLNMGAGRASALVTVATLAALLVPTFMFSGALFSGTQEFISEIQEGTLVIPPPKDSVAELPLVGESLHQIWSKASSNLEGVIKTYAPQIKQYGGKAASALGSLGFTVLQFVISIIIAGVFMKNSQGAAEVFHKIANRLAPGRGEGFTSLGVATVRSVVQGVIGVAVIQSVLAGVGMAIVGIPGTGVWMLAVLILAIIQLPPILILGPLMAYVFSVESSTVAVIFMVWGILVSASDAVLKPLLMGRGVDIPMLIILLGALGGMMMSGIVGLFVGAVVLALGYKLFIAWIDTVADTDTYEATQ
ncbi:AI-2E family transporter [Shewanella waksmanii]|uniref:AI-2E family transporter n=1 Tax=Shewanella waksmanii TaxID=213783 RepID=UPI0037360F59